MFKYPRYPLRILIPAMERQPGGNMAVLHHIYDLLSGDPVSSSPLLLQPYSQLNALSTLESAISQTNTTTSTQRRDSMTSHSARRWLLQPAGSGLVHRGPPHASQPCRAQCRDDGASYPFRSCQPSESHSHGLGTLSCLVHAAQGVAF